MSVKTGVIVAAKLLALFVGYDVPPTTHPSDFCAGVRFAAYAFHPIEKEFDDAPIEMRDKTGKVVMRCDADGSYYPQQPSDPRAWLQKPEYQFEPFAVPSGKYFRSDRVGAAMVVAPSGAGSLSTTK